MAAPLSVIIPTLDCASELRVTCRALFEGLEAGLIRELIISDGGSSDDVSTLADALGAVFVAGPAGRGGQLQRGANAAKGDWFLFLHADTVLEKGWSGEITEFLAVKADQAAVFRLGFRARGPAAGFVAGWANIRTRIFRLPYGDQGLLISRERFNEVGGYPDIPLMEDVAISRILGGKFAILNSKAMTSAAKYQKEGWIKRGGKNLILLTKYFLGVSPKKLARAYRGQAE